MNEEYTNVPGYGKQVELKEPWRGYHRGTIIGRSGYKYTIQLSSGATIDRYEDEFEID